jgi:cytochrome P450
MDPLSPAPPQGAYFDRVLNAWVLSRYADVLAALREPALQQARSKASDRGPSMRAQVLAALPPAALPPVKRAEWQIAVEALAHRMIRTLPANRPVDLVGEVLRPWSVEIAILSLRDPPTRKRSLRRILRSRAAGRTASSGRLSGKLAKTRFEFFFRKRPGDKSAFIGISETLPAFLADAWVALLRHPAELARLRAQPDLIPSATEELLRFAGLVHSLTREASSNVDLAGVRIAAGDRVILKIASANRDPQQFSDPDCLNLTRPGVDRVALSHLALGHGEHSCAGTALLRVASAAITRAFVQGLADAKIAGDVEWIWGDTLVSPAALLVAIPVATPLTISQ